ncbi:MAG: hypothetical protein ACFFCW_23900 [Candidatus Hodarchaeota archaeon]
MILQKCVNILCNVRVKPGSVDKVSLKDIEEDGILITEKEKTLFNPDTTITEETETILVKIFRLDVESKKGRLRITDGMEPRDISFQIIGDQALGPYIDALKSDQVKVNILKEMALSITGKPYLKRILIVGLPGNKSDQGNLF